MGLNDTPSASRFTIGIFGRRNAGKSSLINAITSQNIALTSDIAGTTTDPVYKTMEILPIGPCMIIDTAGLDDDSSLGKKRIEKSYEALRKCDMAVLTLDACQGVNAFNTLEKDLADELTKRNIPFVIAINRSDKVDDTILLQIAARIHKTLPAVPAVKTAATLNVGIEELKKAIIDSYGKIHEEPGLTDGLIERGDTAILVTPIDASAPKGRLILPQQQVIRDILDKSAAAVIVQPQELTTAIENLNMPPAVVITDSQAFGIVCSLIDEDMPLTSFSILYARQKGDFAEQLRGARSLRALSPDDKILIAEGCTHHRQSDDIGTVKIPNMIKKIEPAVRFEWVSGVQYPDDLSEYKLIIHCGSCMLSRNEIRYRIKHANGQGVPFTNYGMVIAYCTGILDRAVKPFEI